MLYAAPKTNVEELNKVAASIAAMYGPKFVKETDATNINETIRDNINILTPSTGQKVAKLMEIAVKEGIPYKPSEKMQIVFYSKTTLI